MTGRICLLDKPSGYMLFARTQSLLICSNRIGRIYLLSLFSGCEIIFLREQQSSRSKAQSNDAKRQSKGDDTTRQNLPSLLSPKKEVNL